MSSSLSAPPVSEVISKLKLKPFPQEGGWLRELRVVLTEGQDSIEAYQGETSENISSSSIFYMWKGKDRLEVIFLNS